MQKNESKWTLKLVPIRDRGKGRKADPLVKKVTYVDKYTKTIFDIPSLSKEFKKCNFENFFIFYPSIRLFLAAKLAGIKNIFTYPLLRKKNLISVSRIYCFYFGLLTT